MIYAHKNLTADGWGKLTLSEQMANIGSEVSRAKKWQGRDSDLYSAAAYRALELFDLTLADPRLVRRLREIGRARSVCVDAFYGGQEFGTTFADLERYLYPFAYVARLHVK